MAVVDADRRHQEAARQHSGFRRPGPHNPLGARGLYLFTGNRDTLYRIHGTNQPEYIGSAISSGCIRMTNEDVIDLYNRVKLGTPVVVLAPSQGDSPFNPRMARGATRESTDRSSIQWSGAGPGSAPFSFLLTAVFGGKIHRPWPRQRHLGERRRLEDIPLADPIAVRALGEIEMDVVIVIAVGAWPEHRREPARRPRRASVRETAWIPAGRSG